MRGKVSKCPPVDFFHRITPAYAGKRVLFQLSRTVSWDHPRLCGEKTLPFRLLLTLRGSPPPMRGKVHSCRYQQRDIGITPAYAGKSFRENL